MNPQPAANPRPNRALVLALWANAAFLALIAVCLFSRPNVPSLLPAAYAQNQPPIAGGAGMFVMPAQLSPNTWGCYLLDVDNQTLTCYQYWPGDKNLRLHASRSIKWDRKLENFNTENPSPRQVKNLIDKAQANGGVIGNQANDVDKDNK
jgi:hypothetical protein